MADRSNIDKLLNIAPPPQPVDDAIEKASAASAEPIVVNPPHPSPRKPKITPEMAEYAKEQMYQHLKATKKPVSKMTDIEKMVFAEKEQKMIEDYEMFVNGVVRYATMARYSDKGDVFFSPVASTVLDEFFTDGQH